MAKRADGEGTIYKRVKKRKDGTTFERWEASVTLGYVGGKRKRKTVYGRTQAEVLGKLEAIKRKLATGTFADSKLTTEEYLERWHAEKERQVRPRTVQLYREQAERHIIPKIGSVKLVKLAPLHLQTLCGDIADTIGGRTAELVRVQMVGALRQAVRWQLLPRNPAEAVTPIKVQKKEIKIWTPTEAARFLDASRVDRLYPLFYLAMSTGLRRGELLNLEWKDVKDTRLKVTSSKTRKGVRTMKLSYDVVTVLEEHRAVQDADKELLGIWPDNDLIFTTSIGTPIHPRNLERTWKQLQTLTRLKWCEDLGERLDAATVSDAQRQQAQGDVKRLEAGELFPTLRLHDLRHLHASMLIAKGMKAVEVAERLGHTNPSFTLDTYGHLFREHDEEEEVSVLDYMNKSEAPN